jgi:hypothetical protein
MAAWCSAFHPEGIMSSKKDQCPGTYCPDNHPNLISEDGFPPERRPGITLHFFLGWLLVVFLNFVKEVA